MSGHNQKGKITACKNEILLSNHTLINNTMDKFSCSVNLYLDHPK